MNIPSPFDPQIVHMDDKLELYHQVWLPDGKTENVLQQATTFLLHKVRQVEKAMETQLECS